jgi:hypothetical protein
MGTPSPTRYANPCSHLLIAHQATGEAMSTESPTRTTKSLHNNSSRSGNAINAVSIGMETVKTKFIPDDQENDQTETDSKGKAQDIDHGKHPMADHMRQAVFQKDLSMEKGLLEATNFSGSIADLCKA